MKATEESILLVLPVPFMQSADGKLLFEKQACNGVRLWRENFERVSVAAPMKTGTPHPDEWIPVPQIANLEFVVLPNAYHPVTFFKELHAVRRQLRFLIESAKYLHFAIGGLIGDWATFACLEAIRLRRAYCVWTDTVASEAARITAITPGPIRPRIRSAVTYLPTKCMERHVISKATLGLFHGADTYSAYAQLCKVPQLVHNIHLGPEMVVSDQDLEKKINARGDRPLQICYAGRVEPQKGPDDWVEVLHRAKVAGSAFKAVWLGEGSLLNRMRAKVLDFGLHTEVEFVGKVEHSQSIATMRKADILLFCHKTPESPRCLIEALMSGTSIVGYDSPFANGITLAHGGRILTPRNDTYLLAEAVVALSEDPNRLAELCRRARNDGASFSDVAVFQHRSDLIKEFLSLSSVIES